MAITGKWHGCHFKKMFGSVRETVYEIDRWLGTTVLRTALHTK